MNYQVARASNAPRSRSAWRTSLLGGLLSAFALNACTCEPVDTPDGGPAPSEAQLAFLSPLNGAVLTSIDDLDGTTDGIQISVRLQVAPASSTTVALLVDDVEVASAAATDDRVLFTNVTLSASAEGIEHELRAEAEGYKADSVTVVARVSEADPSCDFLTPVGDTVDPPFSVTVSCLGALANEPGLLTLLDDSGEQVGAAYTGQLDGNLRFTATGLDPEDGEYTLAFALDNFPALRIEKAITVEDTLVLPDPVCTITAPTPSSPPTTSPGFDVTVECADVPTGVTNLSVSLDGPGTDPVSFQGVLAPSAGVMTAVVPVTAAEAGATEISAAVVNFPSSVDTVTVEVPAFPVCDAEILQPTEGASDLFDVDLATPGNQIVVRVGALGNPGHCSGALAEVVTEEPQTFSGPLAGDAAQSGAATLLVTVPEGESVLTARLTSHDVAGAADTLSITFTTPPVGIRLVGVRDCDGFGDGCFNLSDPNQGGGPAYQRTLTAVAPAQNGSCPFTDPLLDVEGQGQGIQADGDGAAVGDSWSFNNGLCEASFTNVTLHDNVSPESLLVTLTLDVALNGGASETRDFSLGLDRVAPVLDWTTAANAVFGGADDQDTATAILDVALGATVSGMDGRTVLLVSSEDLTNVVDTCVVSGATNAACAFVATLPDGAHSFDAVGADAAGNALVNDALDIRVDSNGPCVAAISVAADSDSDGDVNASEGGAAPISTDVTATFDAAACAIEDGRTVTLVSSLAANVASGSSSGNAVTFSGVSLDEGTHTLSVQASDEAGNAVADTGNSAELIVDVTAPTCAIFLPTKSPLNASDDEVPGTAGLQVSFELTTDGVSARLFVDDSEVGGGTASGGTLTVSAVTLANGSPAITAECTDAVGNLAISDTYAPVVDGVLPTVAFNNPPATLGSADDADPTNQIGIQASLNVDVSLTETGRTVAIYRADAQGAPVGNALGSATTTTDTTAGGSETLAVPATFLSCDSCSYVAQVSDASGNQAVSAPTTLTVTSELHVCTFTSPDGTQDPIAIGAAFQSGSEASVAFTVSCPGLPSGAAAELYVNDFSTPAQTVSATGESVTFPAVTLPVGSGQVQVLVNDGTDAGGSNRRDYLVDIEAPAVAWDFTTPNVRLTRNAADGGADLGPLDNSDAAGFQGTLSATVSGCDGQAVIVTANDVQVNAGDPPVSAGGAVSLPVSIPDGNAQDLAVACADEVGNETVAQVTADVDTVPPAAPADFTATLNAAADATRLGWVDIDFTMPGDDGTSGVVDSVALVAAHVDVANFDAPVQPFVSIPLTPATTLPITTGADGVPALWFGPHTWNIVLRAVDDVGNVADADVGTAQVELPETEVSFDLRHREIQHVDVEGGVADRFGAALSTARGDLNGDGRDDFVVSARGSGSDCAGSICNGAVFILYGQADADALASATFQRIDGAAQEFLGIDVAIAPSINGDGVADLLVNALDANSNGAVYVYYGTTDGTNINSTPDFVVTDPNRTFGSRIAGVGDVDGDGVGDWIAGDRGNGTAPVAYLFLGDADLSTAASPFTRAALADVTFALPAAASLFPSGFASLGNIDGDLSAGGHPLGDLVIGAGSVAGAGNEGGRLYVLRGREAWPASVTLNDSLSSPDTALAPSSAFGSSFGLEVSGADINGDGYIDLVTKGNQHALIFLGTATGFAGTGSYRLQGNYGVPYGRSGLNVGDVNGDGLPDVALASSSGIWLYLGDVRSTGNRANPNIRYDVDALSEYLVGQAGDMDSDGFPDLVFADQSNQRLHMRFGP